jgi:isocitrate/isopropylmalate dehydrogenase
VRAATAAGGAPATTHAVTVIPGDGIGPEVVAAARRVVDATGVRVRWEEAEAGGAVFARGLASGVPQRR